MNTRAVKLVTFVLVLSLGYASEALSSAITLGSRIVITPTTFALPILVTDAPPSVGWTFDLTFDPTDVQVNTGCDPFSGDLYCSLFTGPVTEGDFFASGAPFNVLNPGFVILDAVTLAQTGQLLAVNGAFGGPAPGVSGSGTLAFVEFTIVGSGTAPISINAALTTVPEPAALTLLSIGALMASARLRRARARR